MTILYFFIVLGVLIFVHEFGHFIVAKKAGVFVEEFALGFGPALLKRKFGETYYRINLFPLGGYVKMRGDEDDDNDPRAFGKQSIFKRCAIILAGPVMNFVLAIVLMSAVFMLGRTEPAYLNDKPVVIGIRAGSPAGLVGVMNGDEIVAVGDKSTGQWRDVMHAVHVGEKPVVLRVIRNGEELEYSVPYEKGYLGVEPELFIGDSAKIDIVVEDGPASKAGMNVDDTIVAMNNEKITGWLDFWDRTSRSEGEVLKLSVDRNGKIVNLNVQPVFSKDTNRWIIGVGKENLEGVPTIVKKYSFFMSIKSGFYESIRIIGLAVDVLKGLLSFSISYKALAGPVMIAKMSGVAASQGLSQLLYFMAFLSINLFILNLFPLPILDGGQIVFLLIEGVARRPIPIKAKAIVSQVSFVLILMLMFFITINDLDRLWGISNWWKGLF